MIGLLFLPPLEQHKKQEKISLFGLAVLCYVK